ncbi:MAG: hypothetical protein LUF32_08005 [Clostridiales bacterium]|nr:hypothetical protein [Clostridiales bacterium]
MVKKILAFLLSSAMCLSMTSVGFAAETGDVGSGANVPSAIAGEALETEGTESESVDGEDGVVTAASSDAEILFSGTSGDLDWSIDENGLLTISGTGDYACDSVYGTDAPAWCDYGDYVTSAVVNVSEITSTSNMFFYCYNLTSLGLSGFDTTNVTDMCPVCLMSAKA